MIYQDTPYYLAPDGAMAEETFIVLREAMRGAGKVAIARLVLSSRERVVTIGAAGQGHVRLHAARAERGARRPRPISTTSPTAEARRGDAGARRGADRAEDTRSSTRKAYEDRYEVALMAMIKEKLKGHKPIIAAAPERGNVVNLMDALKASLGQAKPPAPSRSKARGSRPRRSRPPRRPAGRRRGGPRPRRRSDRVAGATFGIVGGARRLSAAARRARGRAPAGRALRRGVDARHDATSSSAARCSRAATPRSRRGSTPRARPWPRCSARTGSCGCSGWCERPAAGDLRRARDAGAVGPAAARARPAALFDAFEHDAEPYSFRDLILARKYAGLMAGGAAWGAIARSVHRSGPRSR